MKKFLAYCLFAFLSLSNFTPLLADGLFDLTVEARVSYFRPCSKKVREIYSQEWANYELEISKEWNCNWRLWAGVSGFSQKGHSLGLHDSTSLQLIPISLGVKYLFPLMCDTDFYVGAAVCYSLLRIHDHSEYVHEHTRKNEFGGLIQTGIYYKLTSCAFLDFFVDYFYQRFHISDNHHHCSGSNSYYYNYYDRIYQYSSGHNVKRHSLNMSAFKFGLGIGTSF